jgi:hypothetical protein
MLLTGNAVYVADILVHESGGMEPHLLFDLASNILSFHEELLQQPAWSNIKEAQSL